MQEPMMMKAARMAAAVILLGPVLAGAQEAESAKADSGLRFSERPAVRGDIASPGFPPEVSAGSRAKPQASNLSGPAKRTQAAKPAPPAPPPDAQKEQKDREREKSLDAFLLGIGGGMVVGGIVTGALPITVAGLAVLATTLLIRSK